MGFIHKPQAVWLRRALFQVHLWVGLITGLYIFIVCVTGAALVFRIDMQRVLFPALFTPSSNAPPADAATILERLREAFPNDRISGIDAPTTTRPTYLAYVMRGNRFLTILADPVTGRVLGELPEKSLVRTVQELHFDLLAGRTGRIVNGVGACALLVMALTGLVIWWPGAATWRRAFLIGIRRSWRRINFDVHSAVGIWTAVLIAMWSITGIYFVWPQQFRSAVGRLSPITVTRAPTSTRVEGPKAEWRHLLERAAAAAPAGQHVARVVVPASDTAAFLVMFSDVQPTPAGSPRLTSVYLDQYNGSILREAHVAGRSAGDVVMAWVAPLHVGNFGGNGIRLTWLVLGLSPPILFVTGFLMWWTRVVRPRWLRSQAKAAAAALAGLALLTPLPAFAGRIDLRATAEQRAAVSDATERARLVARVESRRKAVALAVPRLRGERRIAALGLRPGHLEAFATAFVEPASPFDPARIAVRIAAVRRDQDTTFELLRASRHIDGLHQRLAAAPVAERGRIAAAIEARYLSARAYAEMARIEPATVGGRSIAAGGVERARALAEAAYAVAADAADVHYLLGDIAIEEEEPGEAEKSYRTALDGDAGSPVGRTKLAAALRYQGKLSDAAAAARDAVRADPTFSRAHAELGLILRAQRSLRDAIAAYREAIRLDPDLIEGHNGLAVALANSGNLEGAVAEFREIVRIDPDSTIGYYNIAYALADLDRDVESAAALREVIRINPSHYNARFNLGELFRLEGKYDDSATQFREYLRLAPDTPENRRNITRATGYVRQFEDPDAPLVPDTMRRP